MPRTRPLLTGRFSFAGRLASHVQILQMGRFLRYKWRAAFPRGPVIGLPLCPCASPKIVEDDL